MENDEGEKPAGAVEGTAKAIATIVKEIPVYKDAVQPAATEAGKALATPLSVINTVLRPVKSILLGVNLAFDQLDEALRRRMKGVPAEKVVEPPASVAGPLLLAYPFVESEPPLREMFERLLATAMNADTRESAHPSFVEIIRQLNPGEARLLTEITAQRNALLFRMPIGRLDLVIQDTGGFVPLAVLGDFESMEPERFAASLGNLERLGLLSVTFGEMLSRPEGYVKLEGRGELARLRERAVEVGRSARLTRGIASVTAFGDRFLEACVVEPQKATAAPGGSPPAVPADS